jgi:hypothetical protein
LLSVLANATIDTDFKMTILGEAIFDRFIANWENFNQTIVYRGLLVIGRFKYESNINLTKWMQIFDRIAMKQDPLANA